jgi:hypothetical protein
MNSKLLLIVCLLLTGFAFDAPAQNGRLLKCSVKATSFKVLKENGNWTNWQQMDNITEKGRGNIVLDFAKMSLYSDLKVLDNGKGLDRGIHVSRIISIAHDTTFKEYGFYCIKFKCRDENANLVNYDLLSTGFNDCHSMVLIITADKIISKQELVMQ